MVTAQRPLTGAAVKILCDLDSLQAQREGGSMNALADAYAHLSGTLRTVLEAMGFEVADEHHHADELGAKCTLLTSGAESFRLVWDGARSTFRVDYCPQRRDRTCPAWQTLVEAPFVPAEPGSSQPNALAAQMKQAVAHHLAAAAR